MADEEKKVEEKAEEQPKEEAKVEKAEPKAGPAKVNYVHAALLLHSAGKPVTEAALKKVVEATGEKAEDAQLKALVSSLEGVNIDEAVTQAVAAPAAPAGAAPEAKKEEKKEENPEKKAEEAAAGLSSLFG